MWGQSVDNHVHESDSLMSPKKFPTVIFAPQLNVRGAGDKKPEKKTRLAFWFTRTWNCLQEQKAPLFGTRYWSPEGGSPMVKAVRVSGTKKASAFSWKAQGAEKCSVQYRSFELVVAHIKTLVVAHLKTYEKGSGAYKGWHVWIWLWNAGFSRKVRRVADHHDKQADGGSSVVVLEIIRFSWSYRLRNLI